MATCAIASTGRTRRKDITRQRLVDAALALSIAEGESALTTVRLTRAAGIVQSGFYKHFESTEACLAAAADGVLDRLRTILGELRRSLPPGPLDPAVLSANASKDLRLFLEDPAVAGILVRARGTHGTLGRSVARFVRSTIDELILDLWRYAQQSGFAADDYPRVALLAELIVAQYLQAVDSLLSERHRDVDLVADVLAASVASAARAVITDRSKSRIAPK